ncbi:Cdc37 N terminal kinase binding-domain-containing protein [Parachaetomium inaequale]|uniref:Cdc37 N terminal kinase binding-domain-containing protein n=1 Tax=Parachaetomium inaequale TaxID=2588326 RepID=A0AAN6PQX6_9PEZI|nr:Cdc37 N terminal kinase binding-domain-containing protein [Parachaetomium inaequale]
MVDYRKWDALELSDDSDIEVHPNVDKRSFIRAKQSQIHMERQQRKLQAELYKHERVINEALLQRLSGLLSAVNSQLQQSTSIHVGPADVAFRAVMEMSLGNPGEDIPPPRPEGLAGEDLPPLPSYSKMMMVVLDEVNKRLDESRVEQDERHEAFVEQLGEQLRTIQDRQAELTNKLNELDQQDSRKITSENYHVGFDSSHVNKAKTKPSDSSEAKTDIELLNSGRKPESLNSNETPSNPKGSEDQIRASPAAKTFAQINPSDYRASHEYLLSHPEILQQPSESDGLLLEAYYALLEDHQDDARARQYVHQARLLQYCRELLGSTRGRDGMTRFFGYMATPGHQGREVFDREVAETVDKIRGMAERDAKLDREGGSGGVVERAVLKVPFPSSKDKEAKKASGGRGFAPEMRAVLGAGCWTW